jgi:CheY-like chemotaxis protein
LGTIGVIMTKILLVEDDKSLREIYGVRLLAEGYDIVSAGDGEEALAMAIKDRPDLIVSDVMMPKISGFDMLDILRSTSETKGIKVIMMTALSSEDQRARGEALGADRYLVKSQVGIEDVVRTVHEVLGDVPTTPQSAQQIFGTPAPSAIARPAAPTVVPARPETPTAAPVAVAPTPVAPVATPAIPVAVPVAPAPVAPTPVASTLPPLPQPTAPFSSPRPASLGNRVIQPLAPSPTDQPDVATLMNQELSASVAPVAVAPVAQPAPTAPQLPPTPPTPPVPPITPPVATV